MRELRGESVSIQRHSIGKMLVFRKRADDYPKKLRVDIIYPKKKQKSHWVPKDIPVLQYTRNGDFIREYSSIQQAERESGISKQSIHLWCSRNEPLVIRGKKKTKYVWRFKLDETKAHIEVIDHEIKEYAPKMEHRVIQYSKTGEFIKIWKNAYQASLSTGDSINLIKKRCEGISTRKASLFEWRYYAEDYQSKILVA